MRKQSCLNIYIYIFKNQRTVSSISCPPQTQYCQLMCFNVVVFSSRVIYAHINNEVEKEEIKTSSIYFPHKNARI